RLPALLRAVGGSDPGGQTRPADSGSKARGPSDPGTSGFSARDRSRRLVTMFPPSSSAPREEAGLGATLAEVRREIACRVCQGDIKRCRLAICPYLDRVRAWFTERRDLQTKNLFGASPPSAFVSKVDLTSNPSVPRRVDDLVSDTDLGAGEAVTDLYGHGLTQSQITRVFSVGLLGTKDRRRLVPAEWSITAVDDILAKGLVHEVRSFPWISELEVTSASGLANNVAVLMFPQAFMFEGLEAWNLEASPTPAHHHELAGGRTTYPDQIA